MIRFPYPVLQVKSIGGILAIDSQKKLDGKIFVDRQEVHVAGFEIGLDVRRVKIGSHHHDITRVIHGFRIRQYQLGLLQIQLRLRFILLLLGRSVVSDGSNYS